jgi:3-oxoacyl-[acyl-carrier protein] reductase
MNLKDQVAIVTGASRGIGRAIAERLASDGAAVVANCTKGVEEGLEVVAGIEKSGGSALLVQADVGKLPELKRLFDATIERFGRLDILVNNAGVIIYKPLAEVTEVEFDRIMAINVKGTYFACQEAAKRMKPGGRIINFSTSITAMMLPTYTAYAASKGAVEQLTRSLAKEIGPKGITVNIISPGPTDTELFSEGKSEQEKQRFAQLAALGRLGQPDDIADAVAMLASKDAHWITGQNIRANGGTI